MGRSRDWMDRFAGRMDLEMEPMPGIALVEITDDRRVLIENHKGVTQYSREMICVKVSYGYLKVCGCGLELARMTKTELVISGRIHGVSLHRRDC